MANDSKKTNQLIDTARDRAMLKHLGRVRLLSTLQLTALVRPADSESDLPFLHQSIVRRLRKLSHHDLIERLGGRHYLKLNEETAKIEAKNSGVYALAAEGAQIAANLLGDDELHGVRWDKNNRALGNLQIEHSLLISSAYVALALGLQPRVVPNMELYHWSAQRKKLTSSFWTAAESGELVGTPSREDKKKGRVVSHPVEPDAYFVLLRRDPEQYQTCFLEADRGTMNVERFLEKISNYQLWRQLGLHRKRFTQDFWVLTVCETTQRRDSLRRATAKVLKQDQDFFHFRFAQLADYERDPGKFVGRIWLLPGTSPHKVNLFQ